MQTSRVNTADARAALLSDWIASALGTHSFEWAPASSDASFRRYFRITPHAPALGESTLIAMDAPPPQEDCRPFVHVAALLRDAGLNAPRVLAQDVERGFLLISDLGTTTYLAALTPHNARALFDDATDALVQWQLATRAHALPSYDGPLLRRELELFPEWYIARHLGVALTTAEREALSSLFDTLIADHLAQPQVFVHRDYMPRNLMVAEPNPGILDFQDAVVGPISYDVVSLFKDAFVSWPDEQVLDGTIRYWEKARRRGLPVDRDFHAFFRRVRVDGTAAASQGARHLRAHLPPRREAGLRRGHAALHRLRAPGRASATASSPRWRSSSTGSSRAPPRATAPAENVATRLLASARPVLARPGSSPAPPRVERNAGPRLQATQP